MTKLCTKVQPTGHLSLSEEISNQSALFKEDLELLEMELKRSVTSQLLFLKMDLHQELDKFYTALMDDRVADLPK